MEISERSKGTIQDFLHRWWGELAFRVRETAAQNLPLLMPSKLYGLRLGTNLQRIAAAAEGQVPDDEAQRAEVAHACCHVLEVLFAGPGAMSWARPIPAEWWDTPIGDLVARALAWAWGDNLVTLREAAEMSGRTVKGLSELVRRGSLQGYRDPREPNPQRRTRVRRCDVQALPQVRRSGPRRRGV